MKKHVNLEMPSILGMGAIGPTLSVLTATLCSVFRPLTGDNATIYPAVMLFLSGMLAVFPTIKSEYNTALKIALFPIATVIIFGSAWGVNNGLSAGESAMSSTNTVTNIEPSKEFSLLSSAYAGDSKVTISTNTIIITGITATNDQVDLGKVDYKSQSIMPESLKLIVPKNVWCFYIAQYDSVFLKDTNHNTWVGFKMKKEEQNQKLPDQKLYRLKGGFFKRF